MSINIQYTNTDTSNVFARTFISALLPGAASIQAGTPS